MTGTRKATPTILTLFLLSAALCSGPVLAQEAGATVGLVLGRSYNGADTLELRDTAGPNGVFGADLEESFAFGVVGGYRFGNGLRLEGELLYRSSDVNRIEFPDRRVEDGNYASLSLAANVYYDFLRSRRLRPYVGLGVVWVEEVDIDLEEPGSERSFATDGSGAQFMAGVQWDVSRRWTLDLQLRTFDAGEVEMEAEDGPGVAIADYAPVDLQLGLRFRF
ncbi:MAG: porin family protein [Acidobacteriota bacterium]